MQEPAMGLDNRRPIDLLASPAGVKMVETFLTRLEYGVYM
jgi:putative toxin-antitoxin system antitoxin component (TIGR02293 family)